MYMCVCDMKYTEMRNTTDIAHQTFFSRFSMVANQKMDNCTSLMANCSGRVLLFQEQPNGLQIHFYYDDVEVHNPLGSKAKVHKLGKGNALCIS